MGACVHCGKPAGLFRTLHKECKADHEAAIERGRQAQQAAQELESQRVRANEQFGAELKTLIQGDKPLIEIDALLADRVASGQLQPDERRRYLVEAWRSAVDAYFEDGVLTQAEGDRLGAVIERFNLSPQELDRDGALTRVAHAGVLRAVMEGRPILLDHTGGVAVNLQKSEGVVWVFHDVAYLEDRVRRQYQGHSQGVSVRVMQGVYYRVGAFKGEPVFSTQRVLVDRGSLVVTTKHLYFAGPSKSLRVPYSKIVAFDQFSDGIGITRDAQTAKPQIFVTGDGWFTCNLIQNLAQL